MMKKRDTILFAPPLLAALLVAVFAAILYWQNRAFEKSYLAEAENNISESARLVGAVVTPLLDRGEVKTAEEFCNSFNRDSLRITLIDSSGRVMAESTETAEFLGNHLDREEVSSAFAGKPAGSLRFSESLGRWMIYYALPLHTGSGDYVLRAAISTDRVSRMLDLARLNMFTALLLGAQLVLWLSLYIARRVRKPLLALQHSVGEIAMGKLDSRIEIPAGGMVRELAVGVFEMAEQLKHRLADVTAERNEKNALLDTMSEAVLLFAPDGELVRFNPAAAELFGFDAATGRFNLARCRIPELLELAHATLANRIPFEREFTLHRNGLERLLLVKGRVLDDEDGERRLLLTVTELTNLRRLESFRSDFIANVSHEIKTPLTCIIGAAEALEDEELTPELRHNFMEMLRSNSHRLNNLVRDILSLAALEKRQLDPTRDFAPVEVASVAVNAINLTRPRAAAANIVISLAGDASLPIKGDPILLEQALVNLLENALKYSGSDRITVTLRRDGPEAVIEVADHGIGIPPDHRKRIFERFYRVDGSRSRELGGTGLGLAIVKHICQLHHGSAEVDETPGGGCTFRLRLPLSGSPAGNPAC